MKKRGMQQLGRRIRETAERLLAEGRCTVDEVAAEVEQLHGDVIGAEANALIYGQIKEIVRNLLHQLSEDEDDPDAQQQALPGLKLPTVIAVKRADGGYYYVRSDQAVWAELESGLETREENIVRAVVKRDQYRAQLDRLRPWMADDPGCTVADALRRERGSAV